MGADGKRVELIDDGESSNATSYIGLGLIASLIVGFSPLLDAIQGNGSFENAMLRFLACIAVCVVAAAVIGRLLDSAPTEAEHAATQGDGLATDGQSPFNSSDTTDSTE